MKSRRRVITQTKAYNKNPTSKFAQNLLFGLLIMVLRQTSLRKTYTHDRRNTRIRRREYQKPVSPFEMNVGKQVDSSKKSFSSACLDRIGFDIIAALKSESAARVRHHRIPAAVFAIKDIGHRFKRNFLAHSLQKV